MSEKHAHAQLDLGRRVPMKGKRLAMKGKQLGEQAAGGALGSDTWAGRSGKDLVGRLRLTSDFENVSDRDEDPQPKFLAGRFPRLRQE